MWICIRIAVIFVRLAMVIGGYTHIGFTHTSRGIIVTRLNKQFFERPRRGRSPSSFDPWRDRFEEGWVLFVLAFFWGLCLVALFHLYLETL